MSHTDARFKELVHYVCWKCSDDPDKLGAVQLNKALWIADQEAYYQLGEPITNARYVKRKYGPVPAPISAALRDLEHEGALVVKEPDHDLKRKRKFIVCREASSQFLSAEEAEIVEEAIRFATEEHTASSISSFSHDHIWAATEDGEEIPHYTVFARPGTITDADRKWANFVLNDEL